MLNWFRFSPFRKPRWTARPARQRCFLQLEELEARRQPAHLGLAPGLMHAFTIQISLVNVGSSNPTANSHRAENAVALPPGIERQIASITSILFPSQEPPGGNPPPTTQPPGSSNQGGSTTPPSSIPPTFSSQPAGGAQSGAGQANFGQSLTPTTPGTGATLPVNQANLNLTPITPGTGFTNTSLPLTVLSFNGTIPNNPTAPPVGGPLDVTPNLNFGPFVVNLRWSLPGRTPIPFADGDGQNIPQAEEEDELTQPPGSPAPTNNPEQLPPGQLLPEDRRAEPARPAQSTEAVLPESTEPIGWILPVEQETSLTGTEQTVREENRDVDMTNVLGIASLAFVPHWYVRRQRRKEEEQAEATTWQM